MQRWTCCWGALLHCTLTARPLTFGSKQHSSEDKTLELGPPDLRQIFKVSIGGGGERYVVKKGSSSRGTHASSLLKCLSTAKVQDLKQCWEHNQHVISLRFWMWWHQLLVTSPYVLWCYYIISKLRTSLWKALQWDHTSISVTSPRQKSQSHYFVNMLIWEYDVIMSKLSLK